eukprot:COSAG05_NODE_1662_length_4315_cov_3.297938_4_plen_51_part_00
MGGGEGRVAYHSDVYNSCSIENGSHDEYIATSLSDGEVGRVAINPHTSSV